MTEMNYVYTYYVYNTVTGDVPEIIRSRSGWDCIKDVVFHAQTMGKEYRAVYISGNFSDDFIRELVKFQTKKNKRDGERAYITDEQNVEWEIRKYENGVE